ncbi:DUF3224 domain-containing protein [Streptomyces botrytidirepellens]|uniref:DUF3224 domain-containing protein n=1 Tax=Streptomyces botrytidirepellens TaxID=2486417 RepID=A0A3M8SMU9_9ACTN|nr:DUF3224 domain-containing protein [Streptomyces botrytidirepellens]RNF82143.1 DUF3224 domain-containing protein [Streptomyces botrytidirepellens]
MTTHATGTFTFADWQEKPVGEAAGGAKLAHATVTNGYSGAITASGTTCQYAIVYLADKTGAFSGHELVDGQLDGRRGSFVLAQHGTFGEDGTVTCAFEVVPGSGTGELAGLTGAGSFTAPQGIKAVSYAFDYELG